MPLASCLDSVLHLPLLLLLLLLLLCINCRCAGTSWRVKVKNLTAQDSLPTIGKLGGESKAKAPKAAVLLTELVETDTGSLVKMHLWRRDMLTGRACNLMWAEAHH